jgi:8-oxo-dGTP pyrophosphatase MutT (NUDIX family)
MENPWKINSSKDLYENPWISLTEYKVEDPSGNPGLYTTIKFRNRAVGILPLDKNLNTWIVGQYRFPLNKYSWEIPEGGVLDSEELEKGALRELSEETGINASKLRLISEFNTSNSVTSEEAYIYLAEDLEEGDAHPDPDEQLVVKKIPFSELYQMVLNGEISDSLTIIAVYKVEYLIRTGKIQAGNNE